MKQIITDAQLPLLADAKTVVPVAQSEESSAIKPDSKLDEKKLSHESLLVINADDDEKDYIILSDRSADWPAELSSKIQTFLQQTGLTREQLQRTNIAFAALNQLLNQGYSGYILRWLALDDALVKAVMYPFLDGRVIQNEKTSEEKNKINNKKYCTSLTTFAQTRVWPKGNTILFKAEAMLKRAYGISGFFDGVETVVTRVWSLLLASLLANDLYYYYTYPDERYDTTLSQIFFTQSDNELSLTASLSSTTVWPELLVAPVAWGLVKALRMSCYQTTVLNDKAVQVLHDRLQQYQSSFSEDVLLWLLPVNRMRDALDQIQRALLWDNRLTARQRDTLYAVLQSLSRLANKVTQWYALEALSAIADGVALTDFKRLAQANVASDILLSLLHSKTQALNELQYQARHYKQSASRETSWYAHYLKPLTRYLLAHYLLWCLGQPESKALQPLFWSFKAVKAYIKIKLIYTLYLGIKQLIDRYLAQKRCEEQGKLWLYMNQVADYACSFCGDLPVFYGNIFNAKNCLDDFLSRPQTLENIVTLLNRLQPSDNIVALDFSNQLFSDEKDELASILPIIELRLPDLQELFLHKLGNRGAIGVIGAQRTANFLIHSNLLGLKFDFQRLSDNGTWYLAQAIPYSKLQTLDLSDNQITNISMLAEVLPHSALQSLNLQFNQIFNIYPIAQILPRSKLQTLNLQGNNISNISALAQALPGSRLQTLHLGTNRIIDINVLSEALPNSTLQVLYLGVNQIIDIAPLARALPSSALQTVNFESNRIVNISALSQALPNSTLQALFLGSNQIIDITPLTQALPYSALQTLNLYSNQIVDINPLAQALPYSRLQTLHLGSNQIFDISVIANVLSQSKLQTLILVDNQIKDINALAQTLPHSTLQALDSGGNFIADISPLAEALPHSNLRTLSLNRNRIINISALAQALPNSILQNLDLANNQVTELSPLAQALPSSVLQTLLLGSNRLTNISVLAQALSHSQLQILGLPGNQIVDLSPLAQALPHSTLQELDLNGNLIADISPLAQALPHSTLQELYLDDNLITDISALAQALPASALEQLDLTGNHITDVRLLAQALPHSSLQILTLAYNNIGDTGAKLIANVLTTATLSQHHPLWINSLDPNEKRIIAQAQPNTNLISLQLDGNLVNTTGAKALCRVLPQTKIMIQDFFLNDNPGIDPNIVDIKTCIISAAFAVQPPLLLRFFCQLTQLGLYPLRQTYLYTRNWLANKPVPSITAIETLPTDEKTKNKLIGKVAPTRNYRMAKIDHSLLWQLSNHTAETTHYSTPILTYTVTNLTASRSNLSNTNNPLVLFLFAFVMLYTIYRLLQTTTQSFSALLNGIDEKNISPLTSNKSTTSSNLDFITGWWQNKSTPTVLQGECFSKKCEQLMRGLISIDHTLKNLDKCYQQLSDEEQADVERIRFYWLEHADMVENLQATGKAARKEIRELGAAIRELQIEAEGLLENSRTCTKLIINHGVNSP